MTFFSPQPGLRPPRFAAAREPGFLAGVLEHMLAHENLLIAFADSAGIDPTAVARAHSALDRQGERDVP